MSGEADEVGWQRGQMRGFRKPEGEIPTQVQILYPPPRTGSYVAGSYRMVSAAHNMESFEKPLYTYPDQEIDNLVLNASDSEELQGLIRGAKGRLDAIRRVREVLPTIFPEVSKLPSPVRTDALNQVGNRLKNPLGGMAPSSEFMVVRKLVDLLWEDRERP